MTFIHCRHNSIVYAVSKQHKHHSTYPSMGHCYEPGHFATFSPWFHFNTTFTHKTASHIQSCVTKRSPLSRCTDIFVCICYHQFTFRWLMEERQSGSHLTLYCHTKTTYTHIKGRRVMAHLVEALPLKSEGRKFNYRCCHWNILFI